MAKVSIGGVVMVILFIFVATVIFISICNSQIEGDWFCMEAGKEAVKVNNCRAACGDSNLEYHKYVDGECYCLEEPSNIKIYGGIE